jgi:hypothetical protein
MKSKVCENTIVINGVSQLIRDAFDELCLVSIKLIPFDRVFDEDALVAKQEQYDMMAVELKGLKAMMDEIYNVNDASYISYNERYNAFFETNSRVERELEELLMARIVEYSNWKKQYMDTSVEIAKIQAKIKSLQDVERTLARFLTNKAVGKNVLMLVSMHNKINTLLTVSDYRKENTPQSAFKSARDKKLVDEKTFQRLSLLS